MPANPPPPPAAFFRRAALLLFALAVLDLADLVIKWTHGRLAFSILWLAALLGGRLLWLGRRTVAGIMAYLAAFATGTSIGTLVVLPLVLPPGFLPIALKVEPANWLWAAGYWGALLLLALGLLLLTTSAEANRCLRGTFLAVPSRWARPRAFVGYALLLTALLVGGIGMFVRSAQPEEAIAAAHEKYGDDYRYFVTTFRVQWRNGRTTGSALVVAYNEHEIRQVPVQWEK